MIWYDPDLIRTKSHERLPESTENLAVVKMCCLTIESISLDADSRPQLDECSNPIQFAITHYTRQLVHPVPMQKLDCTTA
jgi:hypothetical protein